MLSVADIPLGPLDFTGCICAVLYGGREYRLATYLGARAVRWSGGGALIAQGKYRLAVELLEERSRPLKAPVLGICPAPSTRASAPWCATVFGRGTAFFDHTRTADPALSTRPKGAIHAEQTERGEIPYLSQHAENPVDWYPWGAGGLERGQPHWGQARLPQRGGTPPATGATLWPTSPLRTRRWPEALNRDFISIKVDREERPDVDAVYMAACVAMNGSGGWPSRSLTPASGPFWAGLICPGRSCPFSPRRLASGAATGRDCWRRGTS